MPSLPVLVLLSLIPSREVGERSRMPSSRQNNERKIAKCSGMYRHLRSLTVGPAAFRKVFSNSDNWGLVERDSTFNGVKRLMKLRVRIWRVIQTFRRRVLCPTKFAVHRHRQTVSRIIDPTFIPSLQLSHLVR